jgi:hypothetical protein
LDQWNCRSLRANQRESQAAASSSWQKFTWIEEWPLARHVSASAAESALRAAASRARRRGPGTGE